jgi:plasmid stabilization system protein ParE
LKIVITKAARRDIAAAAAHYESAREGLGVEFLDRVEDGIDKIAANPLAYRKAVGENRRCLVERFPYALWFRVAKKGVVIACLHTHMSEMRVVARKPTEPEP